MDGGASFSPPWISATDRPLSFSILSFPSLPPAIRLYTTTYTNVARFQEASSERKETLFLRYHLIPLSMMIYAIKRQVKRFLYMRAARFKLCDEPRDNDTLESIAV